MCYAHFFVPLPFLLLLNLSCTYYLDISIICLTQLWFLFWNIKITPPGLEPRTPALNALHALTIMPWVLVSGYHLLPTYVLKTSQLIIHYLYYKLEIQIFQKRNHSWVKQIRLMYLLGKVQSCHPTKTVWFHAYAHSGSTFFCLSHLLLDQNCFTSLPLDYDDWFSFSIHLLFWQEKFKSSFPKLPLSMCVICD